MVQSVNLVDLLELDLLILLSPLKARLEAVGLLTAFLLFVLLLVPNSATLPYINNNRSRLLCSQVPLTHCI